MKYLYRAPVLGGTPEKLVTDIDSNISFSPDGKRFAYLLANNPTPGEYRLIIRSLTGGEQKTIATGPLNEAQFDVAWSPDGKVIAMALSQPGDALGGLDAIDVQTGKRRPFLISNDLFLSRPVWLPDGSGLLALAQPPFGQNQIVYISYPSGQVSPVTRDTNTYIDLSLAADGHTLAAVERQVHNNLYVMSEGASSAQAREFPTEGFPTFELGWTRDGQLLRSVFRTGVELLNSLSGTKTQLFSQFRFAGFAHSCPDGHLVFAAVPASKIVFHVFRADADGGNVKQLTDGKFEWKPPGSGSSGEGANAATLRLLPLQGGAQSATLLGNVDPASNAQLKPGTNDWLAFQASDSGRSEVYLTKFPHPAAKYQVSQNGGTQPVWSKDGKTLYYLNAAQQLVSVGVQAGGDAVQLVTPKVLFQTGVRSSISTGGYDVSRDGRFLLVNSLFTNAAPLTLVTDWTAELKK